MAQPSTACLHLRLSGYYEGILHILYTAPVFWHVQCPQLWQLACDEAFQQQYPDEAERACCALREYR